jgi:sialidase-1
MVMDWLMLALLVSLQAGLSDGPRAPAPSPGLHSSLLAPASAANPRNSEASMVRLADGRVLVAWTQFYSRGFEDHAPARIVRAESSDRGRTWTKPEVLVSNSGRQNVMSASLLRLQSGEIALAYLLKNSSSDCKAYLRLSRDEGATWGAPTLVTTGAGYHCMHNDRLVQLRSGRLLAPVSWSEDFRKWDHSTSFCYYSDDRGKTWRRSITEHDLPARGAEEPAVVELRDGSVLMVIRTQMGTLYRSHSRDGGVTWTPADSMGLDSPLSPATIKRIPRTGDLLLVWNHAPQPPELRAKGSGAPRIPLTTAVSRDEGRTWTHMRNIESDVSFNAAYSSLLFDDDQALVSYYLQTRGSTLYSLKVAAIEVDWFYR